MRLYETEYGYFDREADEYVILRPDTPRPWINVISNGRWGLAVSNAGGGYSWYLDANLNRITRWAGDMIEDRSGKWIYITDRGTGETWSPTPQPAGAAADSLRCAHGLGYSRFSCQHGAIGCELVVTVPREEGCELWLLRLTNRGGEDRTLEITTSFEWQLGPEPEGNREFHKIFLESVVENNRVLAGKHLYPLPGAAEPWNTSYPHRPCFSCSRPFEAVTDSKDQLIRRNGDWRRPDFSRLESWRVSGRWGDGLCATRVTVELAAGGEEELRYLLGIDEGATRHLERPADEIMREVREGWRRLLGRARVQTPDPHLDLLSNSWLKYQAISCRINGRAAYYQSSGAFGFRDQLQDALLYLHLEPGQTAHRILDHAAHQHRDGTVLHWWHPTTGTGPRSRFSDDLLWLPFVVCQHVTETGVLDLLDRRVPYLEGGDDNVDGHCRRAIDRALERRSPRGLPLIGEGDWNDGLSSCGDEGRGESVWLAHFLCRILLDYAELVEARGDEARATAYRREALELRAAVNLHGWDGGWYLRATLDDGEVIGSARCDEGKIYLNPQTWSIIAGTVPDHRRALVIEAIRTHLDREHGPLLLHPAYTRPDSRIGYITRYAPGVRENGGVYTHAACWAIIAAAMVGDGEWAYALYEKICPPLAGGDPARYSAEPYVTPGSVEGPASPACGRGGWTWYTGSAAWLYRALNEWILGIRPTREGLLVRPVVPARWSGFNATRIFRGRTYRIEVQRGEPALSVNSRDLEPFTPFEAAQEVNHVVVRI